MKVKTAEKDIDSKPDNLELNVLNAQGVEAGTLKLSTKVFDGKVNPILMHQAVVAYFANQRKGLASTKTKGEVRGGGRKPWRQKGTGRARVGSIRSPLWRGGGITFGPRPHSYYKNLPKKMRVLALKSALNKKFKDGEILILKDLKVDSHKTKNVSSLINDLKLNKKKIRCVVTKVENAFKLACRNIKQVSLVEASNIHTAEVINCKVLVLTEGSLREIEKRIEKGVNSPLKKDRLKQ